MAELALPSAMIETATAAADWVLILPLVLCLMGAAGALMLRRSNRTAFMLALLIVLGAVWVGDELRAIAPEDPVLQDAAPVFGMVLFAGTVAHALTARLSGRNVRPSLTALAENDRAHLLTEEAIATLI